MAGMGREWVYADGNGMGVGMRIAKFTGMRWEWVYRDGNGMGAGLKSTPVQVSNP